MKIINKMPTPKYHLYILQLHETGHYYIGVTDSPKRREEQHFQEIKKLIFNIRTHEFIHQYKKKKPDYEAERGHLVHDFFSKKIKPKLDMILSPNTMIKWHYSFSLKHSVYTSEEVKHLENIFLAQSKGNPLCLNMKFISTYKTKIK